MSNSKEIPTKRDRGPEDNPTVLQNKELERIANLVKQRGYKPTDKVTLNGLGMTGVIESVSESSRVPLMVLRSDGQRFPYSPDEVDIIN